MLKYSLQRNPFKYRTKRNLNKRQAIYIEDTPTLVRERLKPSMLYIVLGEEKKYQEYSP